jgi:hypothetical protein
VVMSYSRFSYTYLKSVSWTKRFMKCLFMPSPTEAL